jgi:spore germination cell wall hydrolase CwlJ-like protein
LNDEASFLFLVLKRLRGASLARAFNAGASWRDVRSHIHEHHRAYVEGALAGVLFVAALSLSGSAGFVQQIVGDPVKRTVRMAGGDFGAAGFRRIEAGMSGHAKATAERLAIGGEAWRPGGVPGWAVYDLSHPPSLIRSNLSFDEARRFNALVAPAPGPVPTLKPFILPAGAEKDRALLCLTQAVYYEAGFEIGEGQRAVAQVVLNRLRHPAYPKSVCGVVYQGSQRTTGCQFSFTCDGSLARVPGEAAWNRARDVASQALAGYVYKPVGTATHYHADYVFPYWAITLVKLKQIGAHIFYRMTGPAGEPSGFTGKYAGGETVIDPAILTGGDARTPDAPSAVLQPGEVAAPAVPQTQTVTLTVGGETRTYTVGAAGAPPPAQLPSDPNTPVIIPPAGSLTPTRRAPTQEEIKRVNEALQKFEDERKPPAAPPPAEDAPRANPRPRPPATQPLRPLGGESF